MWAAACLALTTTLAIPPGLANAEPQPTYSEAKKKLDSLNEQVDKLVEKYNKVNEGLKAAKRKYAVTQAAARREQVIFDRMRRSIVEMAAAAYKTGDAGDVTAFLSATNPQSVLDQAAVFSHLSDTRSAALAAFLASAQRLQRQNAAAKSAFEQVAKKAKELREQKATVEKNVAKQRRLVNRLGGPPAPAGCGGTYSGPAGGSARQALQFAYHQLCKPYVYGAEGPNSYDCSGLTMAAWRAAGVSLPRTTYEQYDATTRVAYADLQPGDLVFFNDNSHMGMYVGGGKMIHAPHTGSTVQIVDISSGYYRSAFYGAGRP
jgi:peptidoglycan DL-endopeptidase CwlO